MKLVMIVLIVCLTGCSSSKIIYQRDIEGKIWKSHSDVSTITGLKYKK
jgi:hypothetical protein